MADQCVLSEYHINFNHYHHYYDFLKKFFLKINEKKEMSSNADKESRNVNKLIRKDVLTSQKPFKEDAMVRNIRFWLSVALFLNFTVNLFLVGLFSYLEVAIERYNKTSLFNILDTVFLSVYLIMFYGLKLYIFLALDKNQKEKIYEHRLVENIKDQTTIDYCLPIPTIVIFFVRWTYQIKIGDVDNEFNTFAGIPYTFVNVVSFAMAMLSIFIVITCSFSYYRPYIPPSKTKYVTTDPWVPDKYFYLSELPKKPTGKVVKIEYH